MEHYSFECTLFHKNPTSPRDNQMNPREGISSGYFFLHNFFTVPTCVHSHRHQIRQHAVDLIDTVFCFMDAAK